MTAQAATDGDRIADKLKSQARNRGIDVPQYVQKYLQERIAVRLFSLPAAEPLMVTGGTMYQWCDEMSDIARSTSDIDIHAHARMSHDDILALVRDAASIVDEDGVRLEVGRVQELQHTSLDQPGLRISIVGWIGRMRVTTHLDFSIGGKPPIGVRELLPTPMVAGQSVVPIRAQPWVYSAADKLHSICVRGCANTRLKDYRDLLVLARKGYGSNTGMREAVETSFAQRGTGLPDRTPEGLTVIYAVTRQADWVRYLDKNDIKNMPRSLTAVVAEIEAAFSESLIAERAYGYCP